MRELAGSATLGLLLAAAFVLLSVATPTWQLLVLIAVVGWAMLGWSADRRSTLLFLFVVAVPINLSKALVVEGGVYSPGLSLYPADLLLIALAAWWVGDRFVSRAVIRIDRSHALALLLLGWMWLSALRSDYPLGGMLAAVVYTKFFVGYFLLTQCVRTPRDLRVVAAALLFGFAMQFLYASAQFASGSALEIQGAKITTLGTRLVFDQAGGLSAFRPSGFLQHPNMLGDYLVFVIPPALCLALLGPGVLPRGVRAASVFVCLGGAALLVATLSRGAWISLVVAFLVVAVAGLRAGLVRRGHLMALSALGLAGAILVVALYPQALLRITESDAQSTESRLVMMDQALLIIGRHPVLGVGLGAYNHAAQANIPESFVSVSEAFQDQLLQGVVHNGFLLMAAELGTIGLLLFLLLTWHMLRLALPLARWRDPVYLAIALGLAAAIVGQMVFHLFDHFYADIRHAMLWMYFGLLHALSVLHGATSAGDPVVVQARR
ncbi:MAG: hypothetical protein AMXMBFR52_23810 [Burkholderiales bacterium]